MSVQFTVLVPSYCQSAGTLVALGANELMMSIFAELGPLDVQLAKYGELGERRSGPTTGSGLDSIKDQAFEFFGDTMMEIKSRGRVRFRTAADLANELTIGLFSSIYGQLDPLSMGEDHRDLHVALDYGTRLAQHSENVKERTVWRLVHDYPSHDFVIDYDEATSLFREVKEADTEIYELLDLIDENGMKALTSDDGIFTFLSADPEPSQQETVAKSNDEADGDRRDDAPEPDADAE